MAQTPVRTIRVEIANVSRGHKGGPNGAKQVVGGGVTITTATGSISVEQSINNSLEVSDAQVTGLLGYIGLLDAGIDTGAIETAIATLVAAS